MLGDKNATKGDEEAGTARQYAVSTGSRGGIVDGWSSD
jgi:hypothetical protein